MSEPVVVLDVNETLSDLSPLRDAFAAVGADPALVQAWFAGVLRDGFALAVSGTAAAFRDVAAAGARQVLAQAALTVALDEATERILSSLESLPVHDDVPAGLRALQSAGVRVITLTNGSVSTSRGLLERAGLAELVELYLSVEDVGVWKPAAAAYHWAAERCGVPASQLLLVAVHPWDVDGAARAGLRTAWVNRDGLAYPPYFREPDLELPSLAVLASRLTDVG